MSKRSEKQWLQDHETFLYVLVGLGVLLLLGVQNVQFETDYQAYDNPSAVTGYAVYEPTPTPFPVQEPVVEPMEEQVDRMNLNDYPHFNNCFVAADCPMGYHCQAQTQTCEKTLQ